MSHLDEATSAQLSDDDIERARLLLGVDLAQQKQEYITTATPDAIRNFARGCGDDNPLWLDESYGVTTRWGSQIAPPSMAAIINAPLRGDPIDPELKQATRGLFRGIHVFVSGGDWEWYRPIYPGDTIYSYGGEETLQVKESEFAGRSVIRTKRFAKFNQRGEVVAVQRVLSVLTERKTAAKKGKYAAIEPATYSDEDLARIDAIYASEQRQGAVPRFFEDVQVGEALPAMVKGPLTVTEIICFHAGGYGFTPYAPSASRLGYLNRQRIPAFYVNDEHGIPDVAQRVHWDHTLARAVGNPMAYDYGVMRECWFTHYLTDWIGDDGWVARQHDEMRKFNYLGDTQFLSGEVSGKRVVDGRCLVDVRMRMENQRGVETTLGDATVVLPSREHGPALLPAVDAQLERTAAAMLRRHGELS